MRYNRNHKDRVFCMVFGYEKYKGNLLSLYNALNDTCYTNLEDLKITTMDNALYMSMKNDVSCIISSNMALFEQQSTWNPNMPLRGFMYFSDLYNKYISTGSLEIYRDKLIKLPTPQYYVFYNGDRDMPDKQVLKLSDAFIEPPKEGCFEWTATVLNINYGHNQKLLSNCKTLSDYGILIKTINDYKQKNNDINTAIENAIDYCIEHDILRAFLLERKTEAMHTLLTEYDEKKTMECLRQDAFDDGFVKGESEGFAKGESEGFAKGENQLLVSLICKKISKGKSINQIADELEEDISKITEIYDVAKDFAPEYNVKKILEKLG